jgi:UDP-glucose 4-epimerase
MFDFSSIPVLITGAEGFIGSHLTRRLADGGARVSGLVRPGAGLSRLSGLQDRVDLYPLDIRRGGELAELAASLRPRLVFHLAAVTDPSRSRAGLDRCLEVNFTGTLNLLRALENLDCERLVCADTAEAYGRNPAPFREEMAPDPVSPYSLSKSAAALLCRTWAAAFGFPVTVLRLFLVYGPGQGLERFLPQLITAGLSGRPFRMTPGEQTREYTYIDDAVEGFLRAARRGPVGEIINLGSGEEISLRDLVKTAGKVLGREIVLDPEVLPYRENEIPRLVGDHSRALRLLGWRPRTGLEEGLRRTVAVSVREDGAAVPAPSPGDDFPSTRGETDGG